MRIIPISQSTNSTNPPIQLPVQKIVMSKILLLETATDMCSVAIANGKVILALREEPECKNHIAVITLMIEACCQEAGITPAQLDAVAVSSGPGSYTSLRTGASVAKGLCYALNIPLIAVDTLESLAWGSLTPDMPMETVLISMVDARRDEVWLAAFDSQLNRLTNANPLILNAESLKNYIASIPMSNAGAPVRMSGNGTKKINIEYILDNTDICPVLQCSARFLAEIAHKKLVTGQAENLSLFEPFYMKPPNITLSARSVLQ